MYPIAHSRRLRAKAVIDSAARGTVSDAYAPEQSSLRNTHPKQLEQLVFETYRATRRYKFCTFLV